MRVVGGEAEEKNLQADALTWGLIPTTHEIVTGAETKGQMFNRLRRSGSWAFFHSVEDSLILFCVNMLLISW